MRAFAILTLALVLSTSALAESQRLPVSPAIEATNTQALDELVRSLVREHEGGEPELDIYSVTFAKTEKECGGEEDFYASNLTLCRQTVLAGKVYGEAVYNADRWNGYLIVTFDASSGQVTELDHVEYGGNF